MSLIAPMSTHPNRAEQRTMLRNSRGLREASPCGIWHKANSYDPKQRANLITIIAIGALS